jgi:carboxyl-terminal processing protease
MPLRLLLLAALLLGQDVDRRAFDAAWKTVKGNFYDREFHGVDWDAAKEKYRPAAEKAATKGELYAVINRMIGELKASHCVLIDGDVYRENIAPEMAGKLSRRPGFELTGFDGEFFVTAVYEKGPAEKAGLLLGDRVLSIDGVDPAKSDRVVDAGSDPGIAGHPHCVVRVESDKDLALVVLREKDGQKKEITVSPADLSLNRASRDSARVLKIGAKSVGFIHLWHFMGAPITKAFREALAGELKEIDGLVLDIRGRGGSPLVLQQVLTSCRALKIPLVCLIDEGSRSAKEVFALLWKRDGLGPLVGVRTPGAVLGSTFFRMPDGGQLLLAVANVDQLSGGTKLEGVGVEPDFPVVRDVRYAAGRDAILETGLEVMRKKFQERPEY